MDHPAASAPSPAPFISRSLFVFSLLYGGLVVLAGVLGTKLASLGHWPLLGDLAVESGIFAFLLLVVLSSAVAELHGKDTANRLVRYGFIPLIVSMLLLTFVIHMVPPAPFWDDQEAFARLLGQGARMQFAGKRSTRSCSSRSRSPVRTCRWFRSWKARSFPSWSCRRSWCRPSSGSS